MHATAPAQSASTSKAIGAGPVDTRKSPHARLRTLPLDAVNLEAGFWRDRQELNRRVTIPMGHDRLEEAGNFHDLRLAGGSAQGKYKGPQFMDSDVYKWVEAVAYESAPENADQARAWAEKAVETISGAQQDDGYLNSHYTVVQPELRWKNLKDGHELYCAGHLMQAAVAHYRALGDRRLLDVACRFGDYIISVFGPGKREGTGGHPEIEMALVELYRATGNVAYLDEAAWLTDARGHDYFAKENRGRAGGYYQDRVPVREATELEGHAVRQLYLNAGVADLYLERGEEALLKAQLAQWDDLVGGKLFITGGVGQRYEGEAFGKKYELSNDRCYCETCAQIASIMWNWRLLLITGEARFADLIERTLFNGFLSSWSHDGERFFYPNPLRSDGGYERSKWFGCACCPPNVMRLIASLQHYVATTDNRGVQIHQYANASLQGIAHDGQAVSLRMETKYPWDGYVRIRIEEGSGPFVLSLRIPAWCDGATIGCNGEKVAAATWTPGDYAVVERTWQSGDVVELDLPMPARFTESHPALDASRGCVALERGPLVYCLESCDQEDGVDLRAVEFDVQQTPRPISMEDKLGGVTFLEAAGFALDSSAWDGLYARLGSKARTPRRKVTLKAIPYYAWANRGESSMRVWIPRG